MGRKSKSGASTEGVLENAQEPLFAFDDGETYYPLFYVAKAPDEVSLSLSVLTPAISCNAKNSPIHRFGTLTP